MNKIKFAIFIAIFTLAFASAACALDKGAKVPAFSLLDINGKKVSILDYKGKTVILNFWATWCPPCRQEMPEFNDMDKDLKKSGEAVLLAINMTDGERDTKARVVGFLKENGYGMSVLLDTEGKAAEIFGVQWIPTTVVIDGKGVLRGQILGPATKESVMKIVRSIK